MQFAIKKQKQLKRPDNIQWGHSLIPTGIMIILIIAASFGVTNYINRMEEERSFERLYEEAGNLADSIEMYSKNDREELEMLAAVIAQYSDLSSPELWRLLDSYTNIGMMSRIELLLPGDIVLTTGGKPVDAGGILSFEEAAEKGIHITDREIDVIHKDTYVARHYVPIKQDGQTTAMLYGVIVLGELPEGVNLNPYGGKGALYIIDGITGDFLVDTWHAGTAGNIWALGEREMAPGYDPQQLQQGVYNGDSQYVVFVSKTIGEYLYFYYEPMEINNWRIAVSVPESVVFANANAIRSILNIFLAFELVCFILYFLWMMHYVRKITDEKQKRLDAINHIYDVEKLLFNAHERKENMYAALEKLGSIISAEKMIFWILGMAVENKCYLWEAGKAAETSEENNGQEYVENLLKRFSSGHGMYESYSKNEFAAMFPSETLSAVHSVIAVPIEDMNGNICGILAAFNIEKSPAPAAMLKSMQFSFSMFCQNLKSHTEIQEQGDRDALTGLYNRNRYEKDLPEIYAQYKNSLASVYIDVNGLREANNTQGHDNGDKMLRTVADAIKKHFCTDYIYRTGGDEFVLFIPNADEETLKMQSEELSSDLAKVNYHISAGIQCEKNISSLSLLIKEAEKKMYAEKKKYYEKHDRRRTHTI